MTQEMNQNRTQTTIQWNLLLASQQAALSGELARLLCQYVEGNRPSILVERSQEEPDEPASQDS